MPPQNLPLWLKNFWAEGNGEDPRKVLCSPPIFLKAEDKFVQKLIINIPRHILDPSKDNNLYWKTTYTDQLFSISFWCIYCTTVCCPWKPSTLFLCLAVPLKIYYSLVKMICKSKSRHLFQLLITAISHKYIWDVHVNILISFSTVKLSFCYRVSVKNLKQ